jgi:hypothetical protein
MKKAITTLAAMLLALSMMATAASAYTLNADGTGFVGKGEAQTVLGWNNKQLQDNASSVVFTVESETVTEVSWVCTNSNNENSQGRERTTTTTVTGVVEGVARERNQITGFNLLGYEGDPQTASTFEGNQLNSCPSGPWSLTTPAGDPEVVSTTGGLYVNGVLLP